MKKTKFFSLLLSSVLTISLIGNLTACKNNEDDDESNSWNNVSKLKYFGIENAKNLYISTGSSSTRSARAGSDGVKKLFKITEDGYTEEVKYLDENGKEISVTQQPETIYPINDEYIFVGFDYSSSYLVRKTDGAAFDMTNAGRPEKSYNFYKNSSLFSLDGNNNLYYLVYDYSSNSSVKKIVKVNLLGINSLESTKVSPSTDDVQTFDVDWKGNLIYDGCLTSDSQNCIQRIKKVNGGLYNLGNMSAYWIGLDGCIYYYSSDQNDYKQPEYNSETNSYIYYGYPIKKITIDNNYNVTDEIYGYFSESNTNITDWLTYKIEVKNKILMIYAPNYEESKIYEVYNTEGQPRVVHLNGIDLKSITAVTSSENFYYIAGSDSKNNTFLIKVNPTTDEYTNLLTQDDYDVFSFTASETDGIVFNALRMNDGKKIIGKVGINGGDVTIIDEESDVEISYLERIN